MPTIPLTRVATLAPFPRFLAAGGCEVIRALERAGIAPELLGTPEEFVPLRRAAAFVGEMGRREGIDCLGLQVGARTALHDLGAFGRLLSNSHTLRGALQRIVRYVPEVDTGARAWLEPVPEREAVRLCVHHQLDLGRPIVDGYALMVLINAVRHAAGPGWRPGHVRLESGCQRIQDRIEALSEAEIETGVDHSAFEIPRHMLPKRFERAPENAGLAPIPDDAWGDAPATMVAGLTTVIRSGFGSRIPDSAEAAELAGVNVRTLQRHLRAEGYRFRELVDELRFDEARRLLADPTLPVADISRHLGYPDAANFTHAFRRWTGESPTSYRRRMAG